MPEQPHPIPPPLPPGGPTFEQLYLEQLTRTVNVMAAQGELTAKMFDGLVVTARKVLDVVKSSPTFQDPFVVSLLIDGLKYRAYRDLKVAL